MTTSTDLARVANDAERELPSVLTIDEVAKLLRVNRKTVYEAIAAGQIPGVRKIGRKVLRLERDAVLGWLSTGQVRADRITRRKTG